MKINKKIYLNIILLLTGILLIESISAFAVSSQYWEGYPLTINPGETKGAFIELQNMGGTETIYASVNILQGSEIATLDEPEKIYEVPLGQRIKVNFTVMVPLESEIGGNYNIIFNIATVTQQGAGTMGFGTGAQKLIPVLITEKPKEPLSAWVYYLIIGIILLAIVVLVIILKRRRELHKLHAIHKKR